MHNYKYHSCISAQIFLCFHIAEQTLMFVSIYKKKNKKKSTSASRSSAEDYFFAITFILLHVINLILVCLNFK